jgi:hypothetical protein
MSYEEEPRDDINHIYEVISFPCPNCGDIVEKTVHIETDSFASIEILDE